MSTSHTPIPLPQLLPPTACEESRAWLAAYDDPYTALDDALTGHLDWLAEEIGAPVVAWPSWEVRRKAVAMAYRTFEDDTADARAVLGGALTLALDGETCEDYEERAKAAHVAFDFATASQREARNKALSAADATYDRQHRSLLQEAIVNSVWWQTTIAPHYPPPTP